MPLDVNFNESLTNDVVSFEQLGPDIQTWANSADQEQMPQNVKSDLDLHSLSFHQYFLVTL